MKQRLFGRQLSSQIIWPLIIASVLIGIVATVVSARVLGDFTRAVGEQGARTTAEYVISDLGHQSRSSIQALTVLAARPGFLSVAASGDRAKIEEHLLFVNEAIGVDMIVVTDGAGAILAAISATAGPQDIVVPERAEWMSAAAGDTPVVIPFGDGYALWSQADIPVPGHPDWALGSMMKIDDALLELLAVDASAGVALADSSGHVLAVAQPKGFDLPRPDPSMSVAFRTVLQQLIVDPSTSSLFESPAGYFLIVAETIPIATTSGEQLFVVCGTDATAMREASSTMTRFVLAWSVVAILLLIGMNWWVVRSVATPLNALTASTRRLAEGDFSAKVALGGPSEFAELAEDFNRMTDSLSERSESLNKKVLEQATLYDMSRALGFTVDLNTLLHAVLDSALRVFDTETGCIIMLDRESGVPHIEVTRGIDIDPTGEVVVDNSMSEWVIREGRPLIFNPSETDSGERQPRMFSGTHAALCVPLQTAEGPIGAVTIGTHDADRRFTSEDVRLLGTIANHATVAIGNIGLFSNVQEAYLATVRALAAAVDAKDPYTRGHSEGVATYALMTGEQLGLAQEQMTALEMAAYLHDIGKIGISEDILAKPGKLTDAEMNLMRHHPLIGANILKPVAFPWPITPVVRHHHEHFDGRGYPAGLKSSEIPLLARVLTVSDAFEAMVADRPYRRGRSHQEAILELEHCAGTQFDPRIVEAFVTALEAREGTPQDLSDHEMHIGDDEAQAVFIAIADGMFSSFRRLGGPRLASNFEKAVNADLADTDIPLTFKGGRLSLTPTVELVDEEYTRFLKDALGIVRFRIEEASGAGLVENFLSEAVEALPERMRTHAERLGFSPTT